MTGWREEEESAAITRQRKREAKEADKVVDALGNRRTVETFQGSAAWTVFSAFEATTAALVRDAEDPFWHERAYCINL